MFSQIRHTNGQQVHEKVLNITNHQGKANQNHNEIIVSHLLEWLLFRRQEISAGEDVEKRVPLCTLGGYIN